MVPPCTVKGVCVIIQNLQIKYNICEPLDQENGWRQEEEMKLPVLLQLPRALSLLFLLDSLWQSPLEDPLLSTGVTVPKELSLSTLAAPTKIFLFFFGNFILACA